MKKVLKANVVRICKQMHKDLEVKLQRVNVWDRVDINTNYNNEKYNVVVYCWIDNEIEDSIHFYDLNVEQATALNNNLIKTFSEA